MDASGTCRRQPVTVDRVVTSRGELVLRRVGEHFEIISNGVFLMDTRAGVSERLLVVAALDRLAAPAARVLIGGLGVGFSLAAAVSSAKVARVTVVEREPAVIGWHETHLAPFSAGALRDPRVRVECADLLEWLRRSPGACDATDATADDAVYDAACLDIDNGPDWTVTEGNAALYDEAGLDLVIGRLAPRGVLTVWSASASAVFEARLRRRFQAVEARTAPVARGEPDVVYVGQ